MTFANPAAGKILIVAEKRSLAEDIAKALVRTPTPGAGFYAAGDHVVTYCSGHMLENQKPDEMDPSMRAWCLGNIPYLPSTWLLRIRAKKTDDGRDLVRDGRVVPDEGIARQLANIQRMLAACESVVHAGDADREGQLIVDQVLHHFSVRKPVQRLWVQELNAPGILKAMSRMKSNSEYRNLSMAALARSRADFLLGMNATRGYTCLWRQGGNAGVAHVGRVQTPTLWLVWEREQARANFVPIDHYGLNAQLRHGNGNFSATWVPDEPLATLDAAGRVLERRQAEAAAARAKGHPGRITGIETEPKVDARPLPFSLVELQKGGSRLGLSPSQTLAVAQQLYEVHKVTTYPRTDSAYLPREDHANAPRVLASVRANFEPDWPFAGELDPTIISPAWDDSKVGSHFGIIPTIVRKPITELKPIEREIYEMIVRRYLAQFLPFHRYDATVALVDINGVPFKATGRVVTDPGWRALYANPSKPEASKALPSMAVADLVQVTTLEVVAKRTEPPPLLDGELLVDAMMQVHRYVTDPKIKSRLKSAKGLGTDATRGNVIDSLLRNGFMAEVKKQGAKKRGFDYVTTPKGQALLQMVQPQLSKPDLTAWFEEQLEAVELGHAKFDWLEGTMAKFVHTVVERIKDPAAMAAVPKVHDPNAKVCPACQAQMVVRANAAKERFWGCSRYPDCKGTTPWTAPAKPTRGTSTAPRKRSSPGAKRARAAKKH